MKTWPSVLALVLLCLLALNACGPAAPATDVLTAPAKIASPLPPTGVPTMPPTDIPASVSPKIEEEPVTAIPLASLTAGPSAAPAAEYSGLAWYGDWLILLPQYPDRFSGGSDGAVLALSRSDLLAYLDGTSNEPVAPRPVPFVAPGLAATVVGFEGYEAIAFHDDQAFLTIEASPPGGMRSYLVSGQCAPDLSALRLDPGTLVEIPMLTQSSNKSYESLLLAGGQVLAIYEANGAALSPDPAAARFDLSLAPAGSLPFPRVEYRITDVTALDDEDRFWGINYFFPGEPELKPSVDPVAEGYGQGPTHAQAEYVERLLEFQVTDSGIRLVDRPPLQLELLPDEARNWEGIVRLDGRGFLLVTDKFPETILAFVPGP
jgi:hypothetical protein